MKNHIFYLIIILFTISCSFGGLQPESETSTKGFVKPELVNIERIAILPFPGDSNNLFGDNFSIYLGKYTSFNIVERRKVQSLFSEQDFYPNRIERSTAARIGRMLGVQALVLGEVLDGEEILGNYQGTLKLRIVNVETGSILAQFIERGNADRVCKRIARSIQSGR